MKKERVVNIRFLFCVFIGLMLGIIVSRLFLFGKINLFVFIVSILIIVGIMFACIIYANKTAEFNSKFRSRKNISFLLKCSGIGFLIAYVLGIIISIFPLKNIIRIVDFDEEINVSGIICDYVDEEETYIKFVLGDCVYKDGDVSKNLDFKILVYTSTYADVSLGDNVSFWAELENLVYLDDSDMAKLSQGIGYSTYVSVDDLIVNSGKLTLKDKVHKKVHNILNNNLNKDNADIFFAVMFGQKQDLSDSISDMFSYAGIYHILAVSGLHIGVLVSLIWFALNKIKMNKYVKLILFGSILLFYSYFCSFSPSVCRASLMAFTLATCRVFKWEYDILSSMSLAGIIILLIEPMALFTISFQLSFMCIFAIISLAPTLSRLFDKIRMLKVLSSSLSISIAVTFGSMPICMNTFANVTLLGILANIVVLPIFSITYILLFIIILLSIFIKPLGVLLTIPNLFLHVIKVVAQFVSSIPFGVFKVFRVSYLLLFIMGIVFLTIHFWLIKKWWKGAWVSTLSIVVLIMFIMYSIPINYKSESLVVAKQINSNVLVYIEGEDVTMIGSNITCDNLTFLMKDIKLKEIDTIIAYDLQLNKINELLKIKDEFGVNKIVTLEKFNYTEISDVLENVEFFDTNITLGHLDLYTIEWYYHDIIAIDLRIFENKYLVPMIGNNSSEDNYLLKNYLNYNYYIVDDNDIWNEESEISGTLIDITKTEKLVLG